MSDRLQGIKAKLAAEKEKADARAAQQAEAQARIEAKMAEAVALLKEKTGITADVVAELNEELADTGVELIWRKSPSGPRATDLERHQIAMRELAYDDNGMDKMTLVFGQTGRVSMFFGTRNFSSAGKDECAMKDFDGKRMREWILDFIEINVDHEAKMRP